MNCFMSVGVSQNLIDFIPSKKAVDCDGVVCVVCTEDISEGADIIAFKCGKK